MFEVNKDALTVDPSNATAGARLGFQGAFEAAYDEQVRTGSMLGAGYYLYQEERENRKRIVEAGGNAPPSLSDDTSFFSLNKYGSLQPYYDIFNGYTDKNDKQIDDITETRDKELRRLQGENPDAGIMTYRQMMDATRSKAQASERRNRRPAGGFFAGAASIVGGGLASLDPATDPFNFATVGAGGFGKSVIKRIATEAGVQGGIEAVDQITGVQRGREMLGVEPTNPFLAVASQAAFGGALRAAGEGAVALGRRWFVGKDAPPPPSAPAPRPAPTVETLPQDAPWRLTPHPEAARIAGNANYARYTAARDALDEQYVARHLRDWDTTEPWRIPPKTDTRMPWDGTPPQIGKTPAVAGETIDEIARRIDPDAFRAYDRASTKMKAIEDGRKAAEAQAESALVAHKDSLSVMTDMDNQVKLINDRIAGLKKNQKTTRAKLERELEALATQRETFRAQHAPPPEVGAAVRATENEGEYAKLTKALDSTKASVERAYARAQGKWTLAAEDRSSIAQMFEQRRHEAFANAHFTVRENKFRAEAPSVDANVRTTVRDSAPAMGTRTTEELGLPANADAADIAKKSIQEDLKVMQETTDAFKTAAVKLLGKDGEGVTELRIEGVETPLSLTEKNIATLDEDGNTIMVSAKQLIEDMRKDEEALKAITQCSVGNNPS